MINNKGQLWVSSIKEFLDRQGNLSKGQNRYLVKFDGGGKWSLYGEL